MRKIVVTSTFLLLLIPVISAQSPKLDPCGLLTPAEIKAVLGSDIGAMAINTKANAAAGTLCEFKIGEVGAGGILIKPLGPGETRDKMFAEMGRQKIKTADAPNVGVPSFFSFPGYGMVQLNAFKGTTYVIVQLMAFDKTEAQLQAALDKLMRTALTRVK